MKYSELPKNKSWKYRIEETFYTITDIKGIYFEIKDMFGRLLVRLDRNGILTIFPGYCNDGCSGPTIDTKETIRPGTIHDALYQALRMGLLPQEYKDMADSIFYDELIRSGMSKARAWLYYQGVKKFGSPFSKVSNSDTPEILEAP